MNSLLPLIYKYPSFSILASSIYDNQNLKTLRNLTLFQRKKIYNLQVYSLKSKPMYVFLDSKGDLYNFYKLI